MTFSLSSTVKPVHSKKKKNRDKLIRLKQHQKQTKWEINVDVFAHEINLISVVFV